MLFISTDNKEEILHAIKYIRSTEKSFAIYIHGTTVEFNKKEDREAFANGLECFTININEP